MFLSIPYQTGFNLHPFPPSPIPQSVAYLTWEREVASLIPDSAFFPRTDNSHCHRFHTSHTPVQCLDNGYVRKQPVAWKEYGAEYWLKEFQESIYRCDITEILLKMA